MAGRIGCIVIASFAFLVHGPSLASFKFPEDFSGVIICLIIISFNDGDLYLQNLYIGHRMEVTLAIAPVVIIVLFKRHYFFASEFGFVAWSFFFLMNNPLKKNNIWIRDWGFVCVWTIHRRGKYENRHALKLLCIILCTGSPPPKKRTALLPQLSSWLLYKILKNGYLWSEFFMLILFPESFCSPQTLVRALRYVHMTYALSYFHFCAVLSY